MIPHEYIEELTRRTDIVELVGSYVQLKRKGRLYGGLCPFHSEKSPSLLRLPGHPELLLLWLRGRRRCHYLCQKINSIDYPEAVKMLAARAGMPEPQEDDKTGRMRSRILSMNKEAARFSHACPSTPLWRRPGRPVPTGDGAAWTTRPSSGSGWAMPPTTGRPCISFARQGLQSAGAGRQWSVQAQSVRADLLPVLEAGDDPHFDLRGNIICLWRPRAG